MFTLLLLNCTHVYVILFTYTCIAVELYTFLRDLAYIALNFLSSLKYTTQKKKRPLGGRGVSIHYPWLTVLFSTFLLKTTSPRSVITFHPSNKATESKSPYPPSTRRPNRGLVEFYCQALHPLQPSIRTTCSHELRMRPAFRTIRLCLYSLNKLLFRKCWGQKFTVPEKNGCELLDI